MTIRAIETVYKGYRFRSRLEARWAVFFDTLGVEWQYEVEGFEFELTDHGKIYYLPDFYIPSWDKYVEIKPLGKEITEDEFLKCSGFAQKNEKTLLLIVGEPWPSSYTIVTCIPVFSKPENKTIVGVDGNRKVFAFGYKSNRTYLFYAIGNPYQIEPTCFWPLSQEFVGYKDESENTTCMWILTKEEMEAGIAPLIDDLEDDGQIEVAIDCHPTSGYILGNAYLAARQARFEHGQNGT